MWDKIWFPCGADGGSYPIRADSKLSSPAPKERTYAQVYGDAMTKFSLMDSLPNFLTQGAPLSAPELRYNRDYVVDIF